MTQQEQIELARKLFEEGWSGGAPESPLPFLTDDVVMRDIAGHPEALVGHEAIIGFFGPVATRLTVLPEEYFLNESGMALTWMAYIAVGSDDDPNAGPEGYMCAEGMSRLEFRDDKVCLEIDYWHGPQGRCDDRREHFEKRKKMQRGERGAITGA
jgi:hypothetical protein